MGRVAQLLISLGSQQHRGYPILRVCLCEGWMPQTSTSRFRPIDRRPCKERKDGSASFLVIQRWANLRLRTVMRLLLRFPQDLLSEPHRF